MLFVDTLCWSVSLVCTHRQLKNRLGHIRVPCYVKAYPVWAQQVLVTLEAGGA